MSSASVDVPDPKKLETDLSLESLQNLLIGLGCSEKCESKEVALGLLHNTRATRLSVKNHVSVLEELVLTVCMIYIWHKQNFGKNIGGCITCYNCFVCVWESIWGKYNDYTALPLHLYG